jgi:hypothetical protein
MCGRLISRQLINRLVEVKSQRNVKDDDEMLLVAFFLMKGEILIVRCPSVLKRDCVAPTHFEKDRERAHNYRYRFIFHSSSVGELVRARPIVPSSAGKLMSRDP